MISKNNQFFIVLLLLSQSIFSMDTAIIEKKAVFVPKYLGNVSLLYKNGDFNVKTPNGLLAIQRGDLDKELRGISKKKLDLLIATGAYLSLNKSEGDEYSLRLNNRLKGGGIFGAHFGFYTGKFLTHLVAHGTILIIGACSGPAAPAVIASLEATFGGAIEATSNIIGIGCGIAGGTATGPV